MRHLSLQQESFLRLFPDPHGSTNAGTTAHLYTSSHSKKLVSCTHMHVHSVQILRKNFNLLIVSFFSADDSARVNILDNKDVQDDMSDTIAGKGV